MGKSITDDFLKIITVDLEMVLVHDTDVILYPASVSVKIIMLYNRLDARLLYTDVNFKLMEVHSFFMNRVV